MAIFYYVLCCSHPRAVYYFKEFPFYNNQLKNQRLNAYKTLICFLIFLFYEELSVQKINHAFRGYAISYEVELVEKKDRFEQLEASRLSIKDLFNDLFNDIKGFKY